MNDAEVGSDSQGEEEEQFVDVVREDMNLLGVTAEDADERVGQWQMMGCGHY